MSELLPCPYCGGNHSKYHQSSSSDERNGYNFTGKISCPCGVNVVVHSREDGGGWCIESAESVKARTIALWNKRAP